MRNVLNRKNYVLGAYTFLILLYLYLSIAFPADKSALIKYHKSLSDARLVSGSISLLIVGVWWIAYYGFAQLKKYADLLRKDEDGTCMKYIAWGCLLLAAEWPIRGDVRYLIPRITGHMPSWEVPLNIASNYLNVALLLAALLLIFRGAHGLNRSQKIQQPGLYSIFGLVVALAALGSVYVLSVFDPSLLHLGFKAAPYYLPNWLVLTTLVMPLIFAWSIGLLAALEIYLYHREVKGVVYKRSLTNLAFGLAIVVVDSAFLFYALSHTGKSSRLHLTAILYAVYLFIFILLIGNLFIASGAQKLRKLEEV